MESLSEASSSLLWSCWMLQETLRLWGSSAGDSHCRPHPAPSAKWTAACLSASLQARFCHYGPVAQNHLWAQLLSSFHLLEGGPVPLGTLTNEVRVRHRSSLNLSADLGLLSPWQRTAGSPRPREGRHALAQCCSRLAVPLGANTNVRSSWEAPETVIESKCEVLTGSGPCWLMVHHQQMDAKTLPSCRTNKFFMFSAAGDKEPTQTGFRAAEPDFKSAAGDVALLWLS